MDDHKFNFQMPLSIEQETLAVLKEIRDLLKQPQPKEKKRNER